MWSRLAWGARYFPTRYFPLTERSGPDTRHGTYIHSPTGLPGERRLNVPIRVWSAGGSHGLSFRIPLKHGRQRKKEAQTARE